MKRAAKNDACCWEAVERNTSWVLERAASATVVSSRIRIARNLSGFPFPHNMTFRQAVEAENEVWRAFLGFRSSGREIYMLEMNALSEMEKGFLCERHMVSREFTRSSMPCSVAIFPGEKISVMVNEEDHLRIQSFRPGERLDEALLDADRLDDHLGGQLSYAFSGRLGFLTSCPTNIGTGLRASVILHVPGLDVSGRGKEVMKEAGKQGVLVRGFYGEGSRSMGSFYQVSTRETTGKDEKEIIENLQVVVNLTVREESKALLLLSNSKEKMEMERSLKRRLRSSTLSSYAFFSLFSRLVLARKLGIAGFDTEKIGRFLHCALPNHMQIKAGRKMSPEERDEERGRMVRERLRRCIDV